MKGIYDQSVKCFANTLKTGEDWLLYVYPSCYALKTYVSPATGYLVLGLVCLHKSVDLTNIEYSQLQHLSIFLDDYMKNMKKIFDVMKKRVLDERTDDQSVQQIRQIRTFPRNQTFAVEDLIYLSVPSVI